MLLILIEEERPMWSLFYHFRTTINSAPAKRFDKLDSNWEFRFVGVKIDTFLRISKDWGRWRGGTGEDEIPSGRGPSGISGEGTLQPLWDHAAVGPSDLLSVSVYVVR